MVMFYKMLVCSAVRVCVCVCGSVISAVTLQFEVRRVSDC